MDPHETQLLMKARQNAYDLLRCFFLQEPSEDFFRALKEEDFLKHLQGFHPDLDRGVELLSEVISSPTMNLILPDLMLEFTRLFIGPLPVPLYESVYRSQGGLIMQQETLAVRRKYMEAGLVVNPEQSFPDDHIGAELEFVFYLCQKAGQSEDPKARETLLRMQQDFFREHLMVWVSPLCDRLFREAQSSYFKGAAKVTKGFVNWDYQEIVSHFFD